jgi:hypothetical protein
MGCSHEWGELISKMVDQETTPEEQARLDEHLRGCDKCRELVGIFQRNENMLDNALTGEAFGSAIVENVMSEIKREQEPTVIAPEVEEPAPTWKSRLMPVGLGIAAAAAIVLSTIAIVFPRQDPALLEEVSRLRTSSEALRNGFSDVLAMGDITHRQLVDRITELDTEARTARIINEAPIDSTYATSPAIGSLQVGVRVRDMSLFKEFELQRSEAGRNDWKTVATGLRNPTYTDKSLTPNVLYDYRFVGTRKDGGHDAPMPPVTNVRVEADMSDPEKMVDIIFVAAAPALDQATFRLSRKVGGREYDRMFVVKPGQYIGGKAVFGELEIDLSTDLVLERLANSDQVTTMHAGNTVLTMSRVNAVATFKRVGSDRTQQLFRGSSTWTPAR